MKDMNNNTIYTTPTYFISFQKGDEKGFNHFFRLYFKPLLHFAYSITKSTETAEDIVEDSFIKLWEKRETIESVSAIKPYLYTSVKNACIDMLRKQKHANTYKTYILKSPEQVAEDITKAITTAEAMHHVYLALENLPFKYKRIFNMLWVQGKEVKEIAQELRLPLSTVKSQKARTLKLLRDQLPQIGFLILFFIGQIF